MLVYLFITYNALDCGFTAGLSRLDRYNFVNIRYVHVYLSYNYRFCKQQIKENILKVKIYLFDCLKLLLYQ